MAGDVSKGSFEEIQQPIRPRKLNCVEGSASAMDDGVKKQEAVEGRRMRRTPRRRA